ncbi:MAG: DUF2294 domain-containing protein [Nitrospira sp.]|nr:DUF2294 domain-containing protein [Nitrospira sp.]
MVRGDGQAASAKLDRSRPDKLCEQLSEITGAHILSVFTDINVQTSERVFVFVMDRDIPSIVR